LIAFENRVANPEVASLKEGPRSVVPATKRKGGRRKHAVGQGFREKGGEKAQSKKRGERKGNKEKKAEEVKLLYLVADQRDICTVRTRRG